MPKKLLVVPETRRESIGRAEIVWTDPELGPQSMVVGPRHFDAPLERALPIRKGPNYQHRRNYEGHYWCAGSRSHVWYESMTEYSALMYLDHTLEITELSSQPACVYFEDGSRHYPDFFARLKSGKRIMFDVRPVDLIDDAAVEQFSKTATVCEQIGWQYEVLHGLTGVARHNLEWLAAYRHSWNSPPPAVSEAILSYLSEPMTLGQFIEARDRVSLGVKVQHVYNLMWQGHIEYDFQAPLDWATNLWSTRANV